MLTTEVNEIQSILAIIAVSTIFLMRIFNSKDTAAAKHHLIFCQRSCFIREQVLNLTEVLGNVESTALDPRVQLFVVQG